MSCRCGKPDDGWPAEDGSELCQDCWEEECSRTWWEMIAAWDALGIDITDPEAVSS